MEVFVEQPLALPWSSNNKFIQVSVGAKRLLPAVSPLPGTGFSFCLLIVDETVPDSQSIMVIAQKLQVSKRKCKFLKEYVIV